MGNYDSLKLDNQMCFPLYACSKEMIKKYRPFLEELDLTYTQYIALLVLWENKTMSVKDMGERLWLDSGTLTPVLKSLEKKGYVSRKRSAKDERVLTVSVTPQGLELRDKAVKIPQQVGECVELEAHEKIQLTILLRKLLGAME